MKKIFAILLMLGFIFTASAEIFKGRVEGNKTYYAVTNKEINAVYVCEDTDFYSVLIDAIQELGKPIYVFVDNKQLNPEVEVITKKHGNSSSYIGGYVYLNTYDKAKNIYQTYIW